MGTVIGMYGSITGGTHQALATIDVPKAGRLLAVEWSINGDLDTDLDNITAQLSFGSSAAFTTNDTRQVISIFTLGAVSILSAVGASLGTGNGFTPLPEIPVGAGERLYLHVTASATTPGNVWCNIHFDFDLDQPPARRR